MALPLTPATSRAACRSEPRRTEEAARPAPTLAQVAPSPGPPWFAGSPEQAFEEARARGKLVFFYWGAAWCPPCNELRAEVFSKPRFAEIMKEFVPVYLDGDTEGAQRWGEALGASAYPTMLIVTPDREELLRLGGSVDLRELEQAAQAVAGRSQSFRAAVQRLEQGAAQPEDLRVLAHAAWDQLPEATWNRGRCLALLAQAAERCPRELGRERALLAARRAAAERLGMPADLAERIFQIILEGSHAQAGVDCGRAEPGAPEEEQP